MGLNLETLSEVDALPILYIYKIGYLRARVDSEIHPTRFQDYKDDLSEVLANARRIFRSII